MSARHRSMLQYKLMLISFMALPMVDGSGDDRICEKRDTNFKPLPVYDVPGCQKSRSQLCRSVGFTTICRDNATLENAFVCKKGIPYDTKIECSPGYTLVMNDTVFQCHANGQSKAEDPRCYSRYCGEFDEIENGISYPELVQVSGNIYHTMMRVTCNYGYVLQGWPRIDCDENLTWSDQKPTCKEVKCGSLPGLNSSCISDMDVKYLKNGEKKVTLSCLDENNISITQSEIKGAICDISGTWSNDVFCYCDCLIPEGITTYNASNLVKGKFLKHGHLLEWDCPQNYIKTYNRTFQCKDGNLIFVEFSLNNGRTMFTTIDTKTLFNKIDFLKCQPNREMRWSVYVTNRLGQTTTSQSSAYLNRLICNIVTITIITILTTLICNYFI